MKKLAVMCMAAMLLVGCGQKEAVQETEAAPTSAFGIESGEVLDFTYKEAILPTYDKIGKIEIPALSEIEIQDEGYMEVSTDEARTYANARAKRDAKDVDRTAEVGDIVNIDYVGSVDGVEFEGGKGENYDLTLGSGTFIPGFEDQLVGSKKGDEVDVHVTFPEDYREPTLAGKASLFKVNVNAVKEAGILDMEYVKAHSDAGSIDEYIEEVRQDLDDYYTQEHLYGLESQAMEKLIANGTFEPSQELIDYMVQVNVNDLIEYIDESSMTLDDYLTQVGMTKEDLSDAIRQNVKDTINYEMIVEKIKADAGITFNEEVEKQFMDIAKRAYDASVTKEVLISENGQDWYERTAVEQVVYKYIVDHVKHVEPEPEDYDLDKETDTVVVGGEAETTVAETEATQ